MDSCLLCLQVNLGLANSISSNSKRWHELNISNAIEKHFWPLSTIRCNSWICSSCWRVVDDFHKFFLRIEESHMKLVIKLEKEEVNEFSTQKIPSSRISRDIDADVNVKNEPADYDVNLGSVSDISSEENDKGQTENWLDKMKNATTVRHCGKKKQSRDEISEGNKIKKKRVDLNDSESSIGIGCNNIDINSLSDRNSSEEDDKYYDKDLLSRAENDKIIADYFKQLSCDVCNIPLENFFSVIQHFFETHQKKGYVRCCKNRFFNRTDLAEHIRCHSNPNYLQCAQCNKTFSNSRDFEEHKMCDECGKLYAQSLMIHKPSHLADEEKTIPCQNCNNSSRQIIDLKIYLEDMFRAQTEKLGHQNRKIMEAIAAQNTLTKMLIKQDEASNNLAKLFPINSEESLIELEKQIEENSKHVYLAALKDIIKKNICKNIGLVISEDLLYTFNTDGTHGKKRLKDFANFYEVLKEAVKADADVDDVEGAIRKAISLIKKRHLKKILKERSIQTHTDNV